MAGVVTAQRSVTSAQGFSVQPTTKLDGDEQYSGQIEFFPTASDHIPNAGKKVVGGDGEVTQSCAAYVYGRRRRGRGRCAPGFFVGNCGPWAKVNAAHLLACARCFDTSLVGRDPLPTATTRPKQTWRVRHE